MIVAVTGNMGSGKTTVAGLFVRWGANRIDADRIGREVWETDPQTAGRIVEALGPSVRGADGSLNRRLLGEAVFGDPEKLRVFDSIVQPILIERIRAEIRKAKRERGTAWVLDAALLFEWGIEGEVDRVVTVTAPAKSRAERIARRHGLSLTEALRRIESQADEAGKARRSHFVIENGGSRADLEERARAVWSTIRAEARPA
ncbi:MAG: dephospho-CoA kinase [Candidatus Eisenbacteria bacterium]